MKSYGRNLALFLCLLTAACRPTANNGPGASDAAQRYPLKGKVVSVDKSKKRAMIDHEPIPNYMEAMTMAFAIRDAEMLNNMGAGDVVTGDLVVENNVSWLEIKSLVKPSEPIPGATPMPEAKAGDEVPDVQLFNQDGKKFNLKDLRGQTVLLTFIYTRCPLPDYCILMSEHFGQISKELAQKPALKGKVRLLSISLDPAFDRPEVLKTYGQNYMSRFTKTDFNLWTFAVADEAALKPFAGFFGLTYRPENNQIIHSLRTIAIDPQGKIIRIFAGNEWQPTDALAVVAK